MEVVSFDSAVDADAAEDDMSLVAAVPIDRGMFRTNKVQFCKDLTNVIYHLLMSVDVVRILHSFRPMNGP